MELSHQEYLAQKLNGMEYGSKISADDLAMAKANDLVIVTGYSDDNIEFDGAINDEIGSFDGVVIMMDAQGICQGCEEPCDHCSAIQRGLAATLKIDAQWSTHDYSWYIETNIPNAAYFDVLEGEEKFCRGVVFALPDLSGLPAISTEQDLKVIEAMKQYGGSFVKSLAEAATRADMQNLAKIKAAFPDYWKQYTDMADEPAAA
jgi:hypothetical protein